jgi:hypothetical protein
MAGASCSPVFITTCGDWNYTALQPVTSNSRTRLDYLQRIVDWLRWLQTTDLLAVRDAGSQPWPTPATRS